MTYSIVTDVNAGNSLAVLNQLVESIMRVESAIGKASAKPLRVTADKPNLANFFAACDQAEKKVIKVKSQIEAPSTIGGGFTSFLNSEKGKFANVGKEMGQSLQMGMTQQFGMAGGVASSFATALGPIGIAAGITGAALIGLGAASTQAAMKWEDMKTSIGRTTGLSGDNLEDLMSQLQDLRQEFGVTAEAASSMVEQAGSIGVGQMKLEVGDLKGYKQEILDFTRSITQIQGAWGMSAEATSSGIGHMGAVTLGNWNIQRKARGEEEMSWSDYALKVGGTVDNLANAMGSSEEDIVTSMTNASGAIAKWAPSESTYGKWQAMASFLRDTGSGASEAGTQIERVAQKMDQNGEDVAKLMGIDKTALTAKLKTDFMGTVQELGQAIAAMPESSRPDTSKMFGLEGKVLIDKVVADIEAGTGKLQNAYDLALKPGNVAKGYEDVADNASKAFDRIGQAFWVSLEKIGGQLLPIVTDIANGIADVWIAANEAGTALFAKAQENAAKSRIEVNSVGDLAKAAGIFLGITDPDATETTAEEMGKQTASVYTDFVNQGIQSGNFDPVSGKMKEVGSKAGTSGGEAAGTSWQDAFDAKVKAGMSKELAMFQGGGINRAGKTIAGLSEEEALAVINSQSEVGGSSKIVGSTDSFFGDYDIQKNVRNIKRTYADGTVAALDEAGKIVKAYHFDDALSSAFGKGNSGFEDMRKKLEEAIKPVILDMPKWMKKESNEIQGILGDAISDGIIDASPGGEKDQLTDLVKKMDDLQVRFPIEFEAAGMTKLRDDIVKSVGGIKIDVAANVKPIYEDWSSEAFRSHYSMEHGDTYQYLTSKQRDAMIGAMKETNTVSENPDDYSKEAIRKANETAAAFGYLEDALKSPSKSNATVFADSMEVAMAYAIKTGDADLINALDEWKAQFDIGIGKYVANLKPGETVYMDRTGGKTAYDATGIQDYHVFEEVGRDTTKTIDTSNKYLSSMAAIDRASNTAIVSTLPQAKFTASSLGKMAGPTASTAKSTTEIAISTESTVGAVASLGLPLDSMDLKASTTNQLLTDHVAYLRSIDGKISAVVGNAAANINSAKSHVYVPTQITVPAYTPRTISPNVANPYAGAAGLSYSGIQHFHTPSISTTEGLGMVAAGEAHIPKEFFANKGFSDLGKFGGTPGASSGNVIQGRDPNAAQWTDCVTGACKLTRETTESTCSMQLQTENAVSSKHLETGDDWLGSVQGSGDEFFTYISRSSERLSTPINALETTVTKMSSINRDRLGYNAEKEEFYYVPPTGTDLKDIRMGRVPKEVYQEYVDATAEIKRMNEQLNGFKADYINCFDTMSNFGIAQELKTELFQGTYLGVAGKEYTDWVKAGKKGDVGITSPYAEINAGIQANAPGRAFRENGDVSSVIANSLFGTTTSTKQLKFATEKNTDQLDFFNGWGVNSFKSLNSGLKTNTDALFKLTDTVGKATKEPTLSFGSKLATVPGMTQKMIDAAREMEDEYGQITMGLQPFTYGLAQFSAENGKFCAAISDFGLAQEYSGHFYPSFVGVAKDDPVYKSYTDAKASGGDAGVAEWQRKMIEIGQAGNLNGEQYQQQLAKIGEQEQSAAGKMQSDNKVSQANEKQMIANGIATKGWNVKTVDGVKRVVDNTGKLVDLSIVSMAGFGFDTSGKLVYRGGGSGGFGGTSVSGGGYWIGTYGGTGMNGGSYTGSTSGGYQSNVTGGSNSGLAGGNWGGNASSAASGGHGSVGSVQWAEGGIVDHATLGVFGEAGREAFVPISDRSAGLRILPQVMRELGVQQFANGGFVGKSNNIPIGGITVDASVHIENVSSNVELEQILDMRERKLEKKLNFLINGGGN